MSSTLSCTYWSRDANGGDFPKSSGTDHTIYMRFSRWSHNGVIQRVFERLQRERIINLEVLGLDSTTIKVHPDAAGAPKKAGPQAIGRSRGGLTTKLHMVAADARTAILYAISPGQDHDAPHGRKLLRRLGARKKEPEGEQLELFLVADRAYEGDETRQLAFDLGYTPVIPPRTNRRQKWDYDRQMYKRRNEVERLFRRIKGYRRAFVRYDKLDITFLAFITLALIHDTLRSVNTP